MSFGFQQPFVGGALRDATKNGCVGDYQTTSTCEIDQIIELHNRCVLRGNAIRLKERVTSHLV